MWLLLLVTLLCQIVPWQPRMPAPLLDPSWMLAMNEAVARRLSIGTDVVFTFGPWASVYSRMYHPATAGAMVLACGWLAFAMWAALYDRIGSARPGRVVALVLGFGGLMVWPDAWMLAYPLLVGMAAVRRFDSVHDRSVRASIEMAFLLMPLGLLGLVKGTFLVACVAAMVCCTVGFALARRPVQAVLCLAVPVTSGLTLWRLAGQPWDGLPGYLSSMRPIIAGYTESMALTGPPEPVALFVVGAAAILAGLHFRSDAGLRRIVEFMLFALFLFLFLFLSFKAGYVRHDEHGVIAASALCLAVMLLPAGVPWAAWTVAACAACACWWVTEERMAMPGSRDLADRILLNWIDAGEAIADRITGAQAPLAKRYASVLQSIDEREPLPPLRGTVDIYPFDQTQRLAAGLNWAPRPVLQSYSAQVPELAEADARYLMGNRAPDHLLFRLDAIDRRWPTIDVGPSLQPLLTHYRPVAMAGRYLHLQRLDGRPSATGQVGSYKPLEGGHRVGEWVTVPPTEHLTMATIDLRPTLAGRLGLLLYKLPPMSLEARLADGRTVRRRLPIGMAGSPFLLSPWVDSTTEFALLYGRPAELAAQRVMAFRLLGENGADRWREDRYHSRLDSSLAQPGLAVASLLGTRPVIELPTDIDRVEVGSCRGALDQGLGTGPKGVPRPVGTLLRAEGWVAPPAGSLDRLRAAWLVLTDIEGRRSYAPTQAVRRFDVARTEGDTRLAEAGFKGFVDLTGRSGRFTLSLAWQAERVLRVCPEFVATLEVRP